MPKDGLTMYCCGFSTAVSAMVLASHDTELNLSFASVSRDRRLCCSAAQLEAMRAYEIRKCRWSSLLKEDEKMRASCGACSDPSRRV